MQQILNQRDSAVILEFILIIHVVFEFHFAATEWNSVSVIIPKEVIPAMEYLANPLTRKNFGIKGEIIFFLFANSGRDVIPVFYHVLI